MDIVAFSKDWHEDPTSNHHVLRELAKTRKVLWLNSVATRTPKLSSGRDLGKIKRKLREFARGPVNVENQLWVFSPLVLPLPHLSAARTINRQLLRATIRGLRLKLGIRDFQLWSFLPNVGDYVGTLGEAQAVYYCTDEWSMFSYVSGQQMAASEAGLLAKVDAVFAVNHALADAKRALNPHTYVVPHGVEHHKFAAALRPETPIPDELAALPGPRIGFYGTVQDWLDFDLLAGVAKARPAWQLVLLGQVLTDTSKLAGLPNVHLLGRKPHASLPGYCKGFDVGIIPYLASDPRMPYINPIKLREYLSAGLPVVSTPVPEVVHMGGACRVAATAEAFVAAIEAALREGGPAQRAARSATMATETWQARVAFVEQMLAQRRR